MRYNIIKDDVSEISDLKAGERITFSAVLNYSKASLVLETVSPRFCCGLVQDNNRSIVSLKEGTT
jgi:hypothetical protein